MKILYHHRTASRDGQAVHIDEMIAAMRALGHQVRIVSPDVGRGDEMGAEVGWIHLLKRALPRALYELMELAYSLVVFRRLVAAVNEFEPDVVYERYNLFLVAGAMLKRKTKLPLLLEVNSPLVFERSSHGGGLALTRLARWAEGFAWRNADCVLPVTEVLSGYVQEYGVQKSNIFVIPNGINEAHFAAAPQMDAAKDALGLKDRFVVGFTGFVREWHGVDRVIKWMATSAAPENASLLIVGDGPIRAHLEAQAASLGIAQRVMFTGVIHRDKVPACVAAFDIALQPAVTPYASPLKLMEYLVMGKAIVAPREPNLLEVLTHNDNAYLFDGAAPHGLEDALTAVCANAELRTRLGRGAYATIARKQLTWSGNAGRVVNLAEQALSQRSRVG
jgi:glycosyltransferase involved in cell wall biosynthesis